MNREDEIPARLFVGAPPDLEDRLGRLEHAVENRHVIGEEHGDLDESVPGKGREWNPEEGTVEGARIPGIAKGSKDVKDPLVIGVKRRPKSLQDDGFSGLLAEFEKPLVLQTNFFFLVFP